MNRLPKRAAVQIFRRGGKEERMNPALKTLPVIDMAPLFSSANPEARSAVAQTIGEACRDSGFFYVTGHRIAPELLARLDAASRKFFILPEAEKLDIRMARGGRA